MNRVGRLLSGLTLLVFLTFMAMMFGPGGFWFAVALIGIVWWSMV